MRLDERDIFILAGRALESLLHDKEATPLFSIILASWWLNSKTDRHKRLLKTNNLSGLRYNVHLEGPHVTRYYGYCRVAYPSMFPKLYWTDLESGSYEGFDCFLDAPEHFIYHLARYGYYGCKVLPQQYLNRVLAVEQSDDFRSILREIYSPYHKEDDES